MNTVWLRRFGALTLAMLCSALFSTHVLAAPAILPQPQVHTSTSSVSMVWHAQELSASVMSSARRPSVEPPAPTGDPPAPTVPLPAPKPPVEPPVEPPGPVLPPDTPEPPEPTPGTPVPEPPAEDPGDSGSDKSVTPTPAAKPDLLVAEPSTGPVVTAAEETVMELLIKFGTGGSARMLTRTEIGLTAQVASRIPQLGVEVVRVTSSSTEEATLKALRRLPGVVYVEPNYPVHLLELPSDPDVPAQWHLDAVEASGAWDMATGEGVTIAMIDTGIDPAERDLKNKLVAGYDFVNQDAEPWDDQGHGTYVALIAAATAYNGYGGAGVAYDAQVMPVKALNDSGSGTHEWLAKAIVWATDNGADIINLSAGGPYPSQTLQGAVNYAWRHGVLLVAAAGNEHTNVPVYPASYDSVLAVSGTTRDQKRASFSNWGDYVSLAAPSTNILVMYAGSHLSESGTSFAAPQVSGVAALVLSRNPGLSAGQVRDVVQSAASDLGTPGWDPFYGFGQVNAHRAVLHARRGSSGPNPTNALVEAVNRVRRDQGLPVLRPDGTLMASAQRRAERLTSRCGSSGEARLTSCFTRPSRVTHRLEVVFVGIASPEAVVNLLASSTAGQDLLFGSYQQIGAGHVEAGRGAVSRVWVLRFARDLILPRIGPPRPIPGLE